MKIQGPPIAAPTLRAQFKDFHFKCHVGSTVKWTRHSLSKQARHEPVHLPAHFVTRRGMVFTQLSGREDGNDTNQFPKKKDFTCL
ncbi:hypothetical protein BaRGS_00007181 [Batillaria attramentaria]|uniref:Uncharacterized protein n=1 Tax=Batillaria attramentaria TaxID=370345 RepID=A0ABD0LR78_9CAEN